MRHADAAAQIPQLGVETVLSKKADSPVQNLSLTLGNTQPPPHSGRLGREPVCGVTRPIRVCQYGHAIYRMVNLE
jgi:hypothetical protein